MHQGNIFLMCKSLFMELEKNKSLLKVINQYHHKPQTTTLLKPLNEKINLILNFKKNMTIFCDSFS